MSAWRIFRQLPVSQRVTILALQMQKPAAMRIAIPQWQGRIAPVFDVAGYLLLVDVAEGRETHREERRLLKRALPVRATELLGCGTDVLICGAISASLQLRIAASGIQVVAFICGPVEEVLAAYLNGTLASPAFAMPGCRRWRQRGGEDVLHAGMGTGHGRGRFGQGRGRAPCPRVRDGLAAAAEDKPSFCPKCGGKVRYRAGTRETENVCWQCGAPTAPVRDQDASSIFET